MKLAVINPHSLGSKPIGVVRNSVEQILVAIPIAECRFPCDQNVFQTVANIQTHLTIVGFPKQTVLGFHIRNWVGNWSISCTTRRCCTCIGIYYSFLIIDESQVKSRFKLIDIDLSLNLEDSVNFEVRAYIETKHTVRDNFPGVFVPGILPNTGCIRKVTFIIINNDCRVRRIEIECKLPLLLNIPTNFDIDGVLQANVI